VNWGSTSLIVWDGERSVPAVLSRGVGDGMSPERVNRANERADSLY